MKKTEERQNSNITTNTKTNTTPKTATNTTAKTATKTATKKFEGVITALVTPFKQSGDVDFDGLRKLLDMQLEAEVNGLAVCATTGEGGSLKIEERKAILTTCVKRASGTKCRIIAGAGTNVTASTIELTKLAQDCGCDAALIVTPYYNKPTPQGLYRHYMTVLDSTSIPIILYNIPSRAVVDMTPEHVARVAEHERCVGIKDATGNVLRVFEIRERVKKEFSILTGEDAGFLPFLACGGDGIISATSNIVPRKMVDLYRAWKNGDVEKARNIHGSLLDLMKALFMETNPGPAKYALSRMKIIEPVLRLPLVPPDSSSSCAKALEEALRKHGLI